MDLTVTPGNDSLMVHLNEARLDAAIATPFKDRLRDVIRSSEQSVVLDMGKVDFMDSSGLGALIAVFKTLPQGRQMALTNLQPNVDRVLKLTRMDTIFTILPDEVRQ